MQLVVRLSLHCERLYIFAVGYKIVSTLCVGVGVGVHIAMVILLVCVCT